MSLGLMTILEMFIYGLISFELYKHNKLMKMVLSEETIRQRHTQNAVNLITQICHFILEISFTAFILNFVKNVEPMTTLGTPGVWHIIKQGSWPIIHLILSQHLKSEIKEIFCGIMDNFC